MAVHHQRDSTNGGITYGKACDRDLPPTRVGYAPLRSLLMRRENNVQLPDEYDQINNDLRLFWSISPEDLWDRVDAMRALSTTWTLSVRDGELYTSHKSDSETEGIMRMRIDGQVDLIRQIAGYLPDLDAVHNIDDAPSQFVGYNHRIELSHYIEDDEFADSNEEIDTTERGWQAGCSATSPLGIAARRAAGASRGRRPDLARTRPSKMAHSLEQKSFISNHRAAMDPCQHPDLMPIHSAFASKSPVVGPLMPLFSLSKTALHADIMAVPTEQVQENAMYIPWQHRHRDALLWRGSTTGPDHNEHVNWRSTQRTRLVKLGDTGSPTSTSGDLKILASADDLGQSTIAENAVTISQEDAKVRYMDVAFAGSPIRKAKYWWQKASTLTSQNVTRTMAPARPLRKITRLRLLWTSRKQRTISMSSTWMEMRGQHGSSALFLPAQSCSRAPSTVSFLRMHEDRRTEGCS